MPNALTRLRATPAALAILVALTLSGCEPPGAPPHRSPIESSGLPSSAARTAANGLLAPVRPTEMARVVRVVDGDTVIVSMGGRRERVRYIGIDAPESVRPDAPVEQFGREAAEANAALVDGALVFLERDVSDRDHFGRLLRYVWLRDGDALMLVNLELVRLGMATAATFPPDVRHVDRLRAAEREAREARRGLWSAASSSGSRGARAQVEGRAGLHSHRWSNRRDSPTATPRRG